MSAKLAPRLISKAIVYDGTRPLLVRPNGVVELSLQDLRFFKQGGASSTDWTHLLERGAPPVHSEIVQHVRRIREAYASALHYTKNPDVKNYHQNEIQDAEEQFEENETTLSHMYRRPMPSLRNLAYGEAFCDHMMYHIRYGARILEVGCGTGDFANSFLHRLRERAPEIYHSIHYTMFELSPALQAAQRDVCRDHSERISFVCGDIQTHHFEDKFEVVLSNEVLADLDVGPANLERIATKQAATYAEEIVLKYELDNSDAPPVYLVNVGAITFIEKLKDILTLDGRAVLTEFGSRSDFPTALKLSGHIEHTIRFEDLQRVAQSLNLKTTLDTVGDLLHFDGECELLSRDSYALISDFLLPHLCRGRLERKPYDRSSFERELGELTSKIINVRFFPLSEKRDLLNPHHFWALSLARE